MVRFIGAVPQFTVPDVARAAEYYRDVLGFEIAGYWDGEQVTMKPESAPRFGVVSRDGVEVYFNRSDSGPTRSGRARGAYDAYFHVTGLDMLAAELRGRGAEIIDGPEDRVYGARQIVVRDCNDLILAFGEGA